MEKEDIGGRLWRRRTQGAGRGERGHGGPVVETEDTLMGMAGLWTADTARVYRSVNGTEVTTSMPATGVEGMPIM